jgi:hypothetical protein
MNESTGITVMNDCYECMIIERDRQEGFLPMQCQNCVDDSEARADDNAWNLHEDDRLGEGKCLTYDTSDAPSASEWVASQTYISPPTRRAIMIERWDEDTCKLIELAVKFIDTDEPKTRSEFLPPIAQLMDGGVYEEYWELEDMRQREREVECQWCHILTPKQFNDCQDCDKPLELNVR